MELLAQNISIIVVITQNGAIGKNGDLLFHLAEDLKRFKTITTGHTIIMGRKTLLSLPKWPLPNRRHLVLTSDLKATFQGCETVATIEEAIEKVKEEEEAFVIGGASVYEQFYPLARKLYLTLVHRNYEGDTFFPEIGYDEWEELSCEDHYDEKNDFTYSFINLKRR